MAINTRITQTLTPLPSAPQRSDRETFAAKADPFLAGMEDVPTEQNTYATQANTMADEINSTVSEMNTIKDETGVIKNETQDIANTTSSVANYKGSWSSLTGSLSIPASVYHSGKNWQLLQDLSDVTSVEPGANNNIWNDLSVSSGLGYEGVTSEKTITSEDAGQIIDITSGTFTVTFDQVSNLGDGFSCHIRNNGTGDITLSTNGFETIDGLTTFIMYPREVRLFQCDGTVIRSIVLCSFYRVFTSSGTFVKPPGYFMFEGLLWGGGGGGGKSNTTSYRSGGGGGGACVPFNISYQDMSSSSSVIIGSGGLGRSGSWGAGIIGGNSTFSGITSYGGGGGGGIDNNNESGGGGGGVMGAGQSSTGLLTPGGSPYLDLQSNKNVNNPGFGGGSAYENTPGMSVYGGGSGSNTTTPGGDSLYGGGGGGGASGNIGPGGSSTFGGNGGDGGVTSSGLNGSPPAGGGGCTQSGTNAGNGARGELRIWGVL